MKTASFTLSQSDYACVRANVSDHYHLSTFICWCDFLFTFLLQVMHKLEEENARLTGHQNQQQKLHYLLTLKKENNSLKEVRAEHI